MSKLTAGLEKTVAWSGKLAGGLCFLLVLLTSQQVLARYFLGEPSNGLEELKWHLFGSLLALGMAFTYKHDAHVRVDILSQKFSSRARSWINLFGNLLFVLPMCLILCWYGTKMAWNTYRYDSGVKDDHWSSEHFEEGSSLYALGSKIESALRKTLIRGERSDTEGGLEARYLIKATIPLGFLLLFFQSLLFILKEGKWLFSPTLHREER